MQCIISTEAEKPLNKAQRVHPVLEQSHRLQRSPLQPVSCQVKACHAFKALLKCRPAVDQIRQAAVYPPTEMHVHSASLYWLRIWFGGCSQSTSGRRPCQVCLQGFEPARSLLEWPFIVLAP